VKYVWVPSLEILEAGELKLLENESNVSPFKAQTND